MIRIYCVVAVLCVLSGIVGCADREQMYQGVYKGFSTVHENRMTEDPSYNPAEARDHEVPGYQEYKRNRDLQLERN